MLIIEIDGLIHQLPEHQMSNEERTLELEKLGFMVIRFTNHEVVNKIDIVLEKFLETLLSLPEIIF
jgi:5-methyltetrahydrofolate--homocysteine methyltransferase